MLQKQLEPMYVQQQSQQLCQETQTSTAKTSQNSTQCFNGLKRKTFEGKAFSSFDGDDPKIAGPHPPKTFVIESTIVEIVIERAVRIIINIISCSRNKVRIVSTKDVSLSRTFSVLCLILATCVRRSFRFCDSISRLGCFPLLKLFSVFIYIQRHLFFRISIVIFNFFLCVH